VTELLSSSQDLQRAAVYIRGLIPIHEFKIVGVSAAGISFRPVWSRCRSNPSRAMTRTPAEMPSNRGRDI
jgi:hypothetical protein